MKSKKVNAGAAAVWIPVSFALYPGGRATEQDPVALGAVQL